MTIQSFGKIFGLLYLSMALRSLSNGYDQLAKKLRGWSNPWLILLRKRSVAESRQNTNVESRQLGRHLLAFYVTFRPVMGLDLSIHVHYYRCRFRGLQGVVVDSRML
jgi:hypothetical protein